MTSAAVFRCIDVASARNLLKRAELAVFDARDAASYERAHIGPARLLSEANLAARLTETPKTSPVLIYCHHGNASRVYAQIFVDFRFREVYSLDGGFAGWCTAESGPNHPTTG